MKILHEATHNLPPDASDVGSVERLSDLLMVCSPASVNPPF